MIFKNSVQVQPQAKIFFKWRIQVQMKSKIFENAAFSQQKCLISFPLIQSISGPDPKF